MQMNNGCRLWLHEQHCWFTAGYNLPDQGLLAKRAELFRIRQLRESLHIINLHILSGQALSNNQALSNIKLGRQRI
jgi:hypothetical protein